MSQNRFLTYHKVGTRFDSSICWRTHHSFLNDLSFYSNNFENFDTVSSYNNQNSSIVISFDDGFESIYRYKNEFLRRNIKTTIFVPTDYIGKTDSWEVSLLGTRFKHLNNSQLLDLSRDGHEIASHGHAHKPLISLDKLTLRNELVTSKKICEDITGKECRSISVPFGLLDENVIEECIKVGYKNIVTIGKVSNKLVATYNENINIYRTYAVYLTDTPFFLKAKLGLNKYSYLEKKRLDIINWFSKGTVITKRILDKL